MHLHGSFPQGTEVSRLTPGSASAVLATLPDGSAQPLPSQDLFINVGGLTGANRLYLRVGTKGGPSVMVTIDVAAVSASCTKANAALTAPASGQSGCPSVDSGDKAVVASCALPQVKSFAALNAMTRKFTGNGNKVFCDSTVQAGSVTPPTKASSFYKKEGEVVPFVVCNKNPFLASTDFSMTQTPIPNDDLTTFLGFLVPGLGLGNAAKASQGQAAQPQNLALGVVPLTSIADPVQTCIDGINQQLNNIDTQYGNARSCFLTQRTKLLQKDKLCDDRLNDTIILSKSVSELSKTTSAITLDVNQEITRLQSIISARSQAISNGPYANGSLTKELLPLLKAQGDILANQGCIANAASGFVNQAAAGASWLDNLLGTPGSFVEETDIQAFDPTLVTWTITSSPPSANASAILAAAAALNTDPFAKCLNLSQPNNGNGGSQQSAATIPSNPQASSAGVTYSAFGGYRDGALALEKLPAKPSSYQLRYAAYTPDPQSRKGNNGASQPGNNNGGGNDGGGNNGGSADSSGGSNNSNNQQSNTAVTSGTTYSGTYTFGAPRVVVTAGIVPVYGLHNRQFQKVQAGGQTSGTTIEYSTNSKFQVNPMIMAHARLYQYHQDNALWATLGVTASSNNSGVYPSYLVGLAASFLHNWVFVTPGLYIGPSQSLTGGYKVGDPLSTSFTGDIPVQQSYKLGFGLGITFRIPGTSAPKNNQTTQNGDPSNGNTPSKAAKTAKASK